MMQIWRRRLWTNIEERFKIRKISRAWNCQTAKKSKILHIMILQTWEPAAIELKKLQMGHLVLERAYWEKQIDTK